MKISESIVGCSQSARTYDVSRQYQLHREQTCDIFSVSKQYPDFIDREVSFVDFELSDSGCRRNLILLA